jgi:DNA-binding response OmpR family regulator
MKHLVIVDDDPAMQDAFNLIFERAGYAVTIYANGNALLHASFPLPDAILLDRQLSGADGIDICRTLKQRAKTKNIPIIMLSASPHVEQLALQAGADDFVEKPFKLKELLQMVERLIAD